MSRREESSVRSAPIRRLAHGFRQSSRRLSAPARRYWLSHFPAGSNESDLSGALGTLSITEALAGPVLDSLQPVTTFERDMNSASDADLDALLGRAEQVMGHRFDLLGSGPTTLDPIIDWNTDFKTGFTFPLDHIVGNRFVRLDGPDIHTVWELARFQHLPLLAAGFRLSGDPRFLDEVGSQFSSFRSQNPIEFGPNWTSTMDVAIRACNWLATMCLLRGVVEEQSWGRAMAVGVLDHGRFVRSHLEYGWRPGNWRRGNHYLSNVVGILVIASFFSGSRLGRRWLSWASSELEREVEHQVAADGSTWEGSPAYHRLVAEMFLIGDRVVAVCVPEKRSAKLSKSLPKMLEFARDNSPDGRSIGSIGDFDNGRFLPMADYGADDPRGQDFLFRLSGVEPGMGEGPASYPSGGYWVMRTESFFIPIRCGPVGLGHHSHCDQLSFQVFYKGIPIVVDPGSFVFSPNPSARNELRSTKSHSTLQIDGAEQNPIHSDGIKGLFEMEDRSRAECLEWIPGRESQSFSGRHFGYSNLGAVHQRQIVLDPGAERIHVDDLVVSRSRHDLLWTFPLHPRARVEIEGSACSILIDDLRIRLEAPGCAPFTEKGWFSPSYGKRQEANMIRVSRPSRAGSDRQSFRFSFASA